MFRNQLLPCYSFFRYDSDVTIWSPQGRLHQLEYAIEAVKQGSAAVGLRSNTHAILLAVKRSQDELASHQKKIDKVDRHLGLAYAGLMSDARVLCNFMRVRAMQSRFAYAREVPVKRLVDAVSEKAQKNTQHYGGRPYGVGLLVIGYDETGPHLFECSPSGIAYDYLANAIGARSQSARTYLEKYVDEFANATLDTLILHGLRALRDTLQQNKELDMQNTSIAIVGKDHSFTILEGDALKAHLNALEADSGLVRRIGGAPQPETAMDTAE